MVVSPCTTFTLPSKVASFFLSRISSEAASIWIGWSRFCEKPCMALGTLETAPCAQASLPAMTNAHAAIQAIRAIRRPGAPREESFIIKSFRVGGLAGGGSLFAGWRCGNGRSRSLFGRTEIIQIHHHVAFEPHHLATVEDPELVRGECSVQQFDVDMLV